VVKKTGLMELDMVIEVERYIISDSETWVYYIEYL